MPDLDHVFWHAPVRKHPFDAHVRAAAAAGCTSLAIAPTTYAEARIGGRSARDLQTFAEDHGVTIRHLDTLATWAPVQIDLAAFDDEMRRRWSVTVEEGLNICAELGLTQILATAPYLKNGVPLGQLIDGFGDLCTRAAKLGVWVDLEPMPFFGCPTVADAWAVVGGAAQPNSGILMDSWHFFRAGQTLDCLADIPDRCFRTMQLSDTPRAKTVEAQWEETVNHRRWPGQGELPLVEFIQAVRNKGHLAAVGQEVFSLEADRLSPEAAGRVAGETTRSVLEAAGIVLPPLRAIATPET